MLTYKVLIQIEETNEEHDHFETVVEPESIYESSSLLDCHTVADRIIARKEEFYK